MLSSCVVRPSVATIYGGGQRILRPARTLCRNNFIISTISQRFRIIAHTLTLFYVMAGRKKLMSLYCYNMFPRPFINFCLGKLSNISTEICKWNKEGDSMFIT